MKIETNYFLPHQKFAEGFDIYQIDWHKEEPVFSCKGSYTTLQEALNHFYKLCKKQKNTFFRIEPFTAYWYIDEIGRTFDTELNTNFELGNDDIYISNGVKGWEGHVKKLLRKKDART